MVSMLLFAIALVGLVFILTYLYDMVFTKTMKFSAPYFLFLLALAVLNVEHMSQYVLSARGTPLPYEIHQLVDIASMLSAISGFVVHLYDRLRVRK